MSWNKLYMEIYRKEYKNRSGPKIKKYALFIIETARQWGFDEKYSKTGITKLQTIASRAKIAIRAGDREELRRLLTMACEMTVSDLRIELHGENRPRVPVVKLEGKYLVSLDDQQLSQVKRSTKMFFNFQNA